MNQFETDAGLIERSASEPAVFAALYERHRVAVRRYVTRRVGVREGEDLAAEVFVRAALRSVPVSVALDRFGEAALPG